jgi:hypothetical protein
LVVGVSDARYGAFTKPPDDRADAERYMQRAIAEQAALFLQRENAWLETQLRMLLPDERLCVHGRQSVIDADGQRGWTVTWTTSAHVLPKNDVCADLGERMVYGPMPACRTKDCHLRYGHPGDCV